MTPVQTRFIQFITEREQIRLKKEAHKPRPWTNDPILAQYKFCNVNREHDAVTRWISRFVRPVLANEHINTVVAQLYLCRIFNEPVTLEQIFPILDYKTARKKLSAIRASGNKILRGAYYCVPHGTSNAGRAAEEYFLDVGLKLSRLKFDGICTLQGIADLMRSISGVGDFIANQVCTDLRYQQPFTQQWRDWKTFVLAGPGTRRGLNRYQGAEDNRARKFPKLTGDCQPLLLEIRYSIQDLIPHSIQNHFKDINNLSNCFCEFDKYERVRGQMARGDRVTIHLYNP